MKKTTRKTLGAAALAIAWSAAASAESLGPCNRPGYGERMRCGTIEVLENRNRPEGRRIALNVLVLEAAEAADREPLFLLAGGPGQGATDLMQLAIGPLAPINRSRDIVLVDQRGTGDSNPLLCSNGAREDPRATFGGLFKPANLARCVKEFEEIADVSLYGSDQVVADLEEVRSQLGYERVLLWGGSGGTRTALVWMRHHPHRVVGAVLDGVTPMDFRGPSGMARAAHTALERVFEDCEAQPSCRAAFPQLEHDFRKVLWLFEGGSVKTTIQREDGGDVAVSMSRGDLGYALRAMLYRAGLVAGLPKAIHETAASGDVSRYAQSLWRRDVFLRPAVAMGVHFAVYCTEDVPFIDKQKWDELTEGTFLGTYLLEQYTGVCEGWPTPATSKSFLEPVTVDVPTLILSGYYDPSTPPEMGERVARRLPNSRHVVVRNEGHGAGFGCARPAVLSFLDSASLDGLGPICEDAGPVEFETR